MLYCFTKTKLITTSSKWEVIKLKPNIIDNFSPVSVDTQLLSTIRVLIIVMSVIIVMHDKSLNFNNSDGCNNSDA